ncbi:Transcriptional activator NphR [Microbacterium sp. 8M]|uniref:AraC family transcriptional regulator n=1 Tax=Microbacterium sp. 8M TaxID=2653153 RepID=UPI0012F396F4|nr:AraC family transcriptional regulator [Microbacterium sp. 8M]VXB76101.1 Transcriptional activator NphR [Microbacterium sp. 8M]
MGIIIDSRAALGRLGSGHELPLALLRCGGALISRHRVQPAHVWRWQAPEHCGDELLVVCFADVPLRLRLEGGRARVIPAGAMCLLHPHHAAEVSAQRPGAATLAWVRHDTVADAAAAVTTSGQLLPDGAIARSLHAFLLGMLADAAGVDEGVLAERLIVGAVQGVLVNVEPADRRPRAIDRAREIVRMRWTDPEFDVAALAQALHLSRRQLQRMFAKEGTTPLAELRARRVEHARRLIHTGVEGLEAVAERAGFRDVAGMRRAFLAIGLPTPRHLRADAAV